MTRILAFAALVVCMTVLASRAPAQPASQLLTQVQAADVLSDFLTYSVDRTDARVSAMQEFLREIGKEDAYAQLKPETRRGAPLYFTQVSRGAAEFVKSGGAAYADPALSTLSEAQLADHLNTLQSYNAQQFVHLNQQRAASNAMAGYLESIGQFDNYLKWARQRFPAVGAATTGPAPTTPEQVAARMQELIDAARALTWQKAQAMGMSAAEFDARWQQQVARYKESVTRKVEGVQATGRWLTKSELASREARRPPEPPQQSPVVWQAAGPPPVVAGPLPPAVQSKYTAAYYSGADNEINFWNGWNDGYEEVRGRR